MHIHIIDNVSKKMSSLLPAAIDRSEDIRIAVAFISLGGLKMIESSIKAALQRKADVEFLVGLDMSSTEPRALRALYQQVRNNATLKFYCYAPLQGRAIYHPKMYLLRACDNATCIIGSSNLTEGGLLRNVEINAAIEDETGSELISDAYEAYSRLKFHPQRVEPNVELLDIYEELFDRKKVEQRKSARDDSSRLLMKKFTEKAKSLRKPIATKRDLVGWLQLIYQVLPDGEFTNKQIYQHEDMFRQQYPANRNIPHKIRQQLQFLCKMGLIEHIGTARWRKV